MSHKEQLKFIGTMKQSFPERFTGGRVLEIGSLDINGSTRSFFSNGDYLGIDVAPGAGVDLVCQGQDYDGPSDSFDTVISCEVMEHNPFWVETMRNMTRVCKPGGMVIMTCATLGRGEHGTQRTSPDSSPLTVGLGWTYYRNLTANDFREASALDGLDHVFAVNFGSYDLYMVGIKGSALPADAAKLADIVNYYRWLPFRSLRNLRRAIKSSVLRRRQ